MTAYLYSTLNNHKYIWFYPHNFIIKETGFNRTTYRHYNNIFYSGIGIENHKKIFGYLRLRCKNIKMI